MAQELLFNVSLLVFFIYCYFYVGATAPDPVPGQMDGAQWPQIILVLLVIFIGINIFKVIKNKKEGEGYKIEFNFVKIVKSKLFIGSVLLLVYAYVLDYIGFIFGSISFFMIYSRLLGQKKITKLILSSVICVVILYVLFNTVLGIMLPRGTGIFRNFALFVESIL